MFESLELVNFQKHRRLLVAFDPLITSLVGRTNSGKSCVLRALRWLVTNRPAGADYVRRGAGGTRVTLAVDGRTVTRRRGRVGNRYHLDGKPYAAFGASVPDEIQNAIRIGSDNFSFQHDAPYLFSLTPGQAAQALNEVVDLGLIDRTLARLAAVRRKAQAEADVAAERLATAKTARDRLAWVPAAVTKFTKVCMLRDATAANRDKAHRLADLLQERQRVADALIGAERAADAATTALAASERLAELTARRDRLALLLSQREKLTAELAVAEREGAAATAAVVEALRGRCPACGRDGDGEATAPRKEGRGGAGGGRDDPADGGRHGEK